MTAADKVNRFDASACEGCGYEEPSHRCESGRPYSVIILCTKQKKRRGGGGGIHSRSKKSI